MQNEGFLPFRCTDDAVQVIIGPTRQHSRFALGEIATHREPCFRQIQGGFIVTHQILGSVFRFDKHQQAYACLASPKNSRAVNSSRAICAFSSSSDANRCSLRIFYAVLHLYGDHKGPLQRPANALPAAGERQQPLDGANVGDAHQRFVAQSCHFHRIDPLPGNLTT